MKKTGIISFIIIFLVSFSLSPALAGSKERYRWQGAAMGFGAAVLGHAIYKNARAGRAPQKVVVVERPVYSAYAPCPPYRCPGACCCEPRRVWVEPVREKVWNPGHYRNGRWIEGQWILVETAPGHWREAEGRAYTR
mgnify:CR=1 FL=1